MDIEQLRDWIVDNNYPQHRRERLTGRIEWQNIQSQRGMLCDGQRLLPMRGR